MSIDENYNWQHLSEITLQNFKGIGDKPVTIPIRKITLLFGENSAGKSTILHALRYANTVLEKHNEDKLTGESSLDIGNFKNLVHKHDMSRKIFIKLKLVIDSEGIPAKDQEFDLNEYITITELAVSLKIAYHPTFNDGIIESCTIDIEDKPVSHFVVESNAPSFLDLSHPKFSKLRHKDDFIKLCSKYNESFRVEGDKIFYNKCGDFFYSFLDIKENIDIADSNTSGKLRSFYHQLHEGSLDLMREYLSRERISHIGPIRALPQRNVLPQQTANDSWYDGMKAWQLLHNSTRVRPDGSINTVWIDCINEYLEILDMGYKLDLKQCEDREPKNKLIIRDLRNHLELSLNDIGVGVSQVIPVIVGIADESQSILMVEQPELHLHPALQCRLADLLIYDINSKLYKNYIFETHSEHLILRILRRIRETTNNELAENPNTFSFLDLSPEDVSVLYIYSENGETVVEDAVFWKRVQGNVL